MADRRRGSKVLKPQIRNDVVHRGRPFWVKPQISLTGTGSFGAYSPTLVVMGLNYLMVSQQSHGTALMARVAARPALVDFWP